MAGGPDTSIKNASVEKDASFNINETWASLLRNFLIVGLVAATVWVLVVGVRQSIKIGTDFLFTPFYNLHEEKNEFNVNKDLIINIEKQQGSVSNIGQGQNNLQIEQDSKQEPINQGIKERANMYAAEEKDFTGAIYRIFIVLILSGIIRGLLLQIPSWHSSEGDGMARSLEYYHETYLHDDKEHQPRYDKPTFIQAIRRVILTSLTVGCGGSGGIEAPVVPLGECIGAGWAKVLKVARADDLRIYQMAGMSAAVTTLLDAPLTSALFAAEIVYNARILYRPLMYSLIGSIVAFALNNHFALFEPLFKPRALSHVYTLTEYVEVSIVALICSAPTSIGLTLLFNKLKVLIKPFPGALKPVIGAIGTAGVGLGIWFAFGLEPQHVLGVSEDTIIQVISGEGNPLLQVWWILLVLVIAKAFATGFTLMAGGSAGSLVPAMFLGGISGASIYQFLSSMGYVTDADVSVFVVAGLASALVSIVQVPLAAIALVIEVFGTAYGPPAILACVLTYLLAKKWRVYAAL